MLINCKTNDINSSLSEKKSNFYKSKFNIISTYPGEIVKNKFLLNKNLIHCHPDDLQVLKVALQFIILFFQKKNLCNNFYDE